MVDPFFRNVIEKMGAHPSFVKKNEIIYTKNRGGEDIVCIPSTMLAETTLRTRILNQAHQVVGHYSPQRMSDYMYTDTENSVNHAKHVHKQKGNIKSQQANYTHYQ